MSRYTMYYKNKKVLYSELAASWAKWASTADLTDEQRFGISLFFGSIAKRFGLVEEFKALGII